MSGREAKYPLVYAYQYRPHKEGEATDSDVYWFRDELVDMILEKFGSDIEAIRLMKNGPHDSVVFEITVAPGKELTGIDEMFWRFFQVKDAELEVAKAEAKLKRIKDRH